MLLWLTHYWQAYLHWLRVFQYFTFRSILAAMTAFVIALLLGTEMIVRLQRLQIGQQIRDDGPQSHLRKRGTPTMGGALILLAISISVLLWGDLTNHYLWVVFLLTLGFGAVGWVDDYRKVVLKNTKGLAPRWKLFWQGFLSLVAIVYLSYMTDPGMPTQVIVPFAKHFSVDLGWFFPIFALFVIVGSSNAVNLTDGLDGLAIMPIALVCSALGVFVYVTGNAAHAHYLTIPFIPGVGEVVIFCAALVGASLGFLWFNTYPALVFMGDVGALSLGGALGIIAIVARQELVLFIMGGLFVAETLSVIAQVLSFKLTGKRVLRMAPLHHHFELAGWPEPRVIVRFWIVTLFLVLCGLATLKLR